MIWIEHFPKQRLTNALQANGAFRAELETVAVDTAKDGTLFPAEVTVRGPGYCHLPDNYQQEYFNQLISEQVHTCFVRGHPGRHWFKHSGVRNEALDRRVYAMAALHARSGTVGTCLTRNTVG